MYVLVNGAGRAVQRGLGNRLCQFFLGRLHEGRVESASYGEDDRLQRPCFFRALHGQGYPVDRARYHELPGAVVIGRGHDFVGDVAAYFFYYFIF